MTGDPISLLTEKYLTLRKMKKDLADKQKEEMRPIVDGMAEIENKMLKIMDNIGAQSVKTDYGTPYITKRRSFTIVDFESALPEMIKNPDLIVRRVSKEAADEIIERTGAPIPGIDMNVSRQLNVKS